MDTDELYEILTSDPITDTYLRGVIPADVIPKEVNVYPSLYIVNTDPSYKPGRHWLAIYFTSNQCKEFFDSFGNPPTYYGEHFYSFINENSKQWIYNRIPLQGLFGITCGHFCSFYAIHRCHGIPMSTIVNMFSKNVYWNDYDVFDFVNNLFNN